MKILLLNQVFYPDVVSTAQHLSDLASELVKRGHQVTVVSSRRAYEQPDKLFASRETWQGVNIIRVYSTRFGKRAKWRRAADFASFLIFCCARLLVLSRYDVVIALTTPPLISFIGAWRAKLWRAKFGYWVMDFNPDEAIAAGWLRPGSLVARFLEMLSLFSLRQATQIVALDRFMRDRIAAKGIDPQKVAVIPPWSHDDEVQFDAPGRNKFRYQHGLSDKFVVAYSGNHSPVHPLDTLMRAADHLRQQTDIVFAFIGGGSEFGRVKRWAAGNPQVLCLPYQPLSELSASLSAADAHVVVAGNAMVGLVHPCKIYNIFAVSAPVIYIGPNPSHITDIFDGHSDYPWIEIRHGEAEKLAEQIRLMAARGGENQRRRSEVMIHSFSKRALLPGMVAAVEK